MRLLFLISVALTLAAASVVAQEDEIVANLAGGRVLIHVTQDAIIFSAIDHPLEAKAVPPRVATIGSTHIGIFFGASEWQIPAQPRPIRLERQLEDVRPAETGAYRPPGSGEEDLEIIGVTFLEKLRPLVSQLHHRFDLKPDEPLVEIVLIGYAPKQYGPEVWLIDYNVEQESVGSRSEYWQTHALRPRFTQLYPPEKHAAKNLVEVRFPSELEGLPLMALIQQNDPRIARLCSSEQRFAKVVEQLEHGQANKSNSEDAADFMRAALPLLAGNASFFEGKLGEAGGFDWIVSPEEPQEKEQRAEDKDRPPDAPTLMRKPKTNP
ncbi:MAG TPA: hypothetical protein VEI54_12240 [Candidatus Limnocylindrales bacterium]|nr:hypothetical protein [Candidatus Limnocylindrales bacterium]